MFDSTTSTTAIIKLDENNKPGIVPVSQDPSEEVDAKLESFVYKQVRASSNVGGDFLCALHGGVNYQIEHHLFPRMSHAHYPKIREAVKAFCEKKGIRYVHFPNMLANLYSTAKHFYYLGHPMYSTMINK
jgi:fatty acid desaturase